MSDFNFKIDPSNYGGIDHEAYRSDMLQLALSQPTVYTQLRKDVLHAVKKEAVNSQYAIYFYLLTEGCKVAPNGKDLGVSVLNFDGSKSQAQAGVFKPHVPYQVVNEFALKASKTIDRISEEAIEMILPKDWKEIADNRTFTKTKSTLGFEG
jgi:hypothetical protein